MSERSVPASARDLARARRGGDFPHSPLLVTAALLLAARALGPRSFETVRSSFAASWRAALSGVGLREALSRASQGLVRALAPVLITLALTATAATLLQTGAAYQSGPRVARPAPEGFTALAALLALGVTLATAVSSRPDQPTVTGMTEMLRASFDALTVTLLLTGVMDLAIRRWRWRRQLQQTPTEARRTARDEEGDPFARSARRGIHRALLDVPTVRADWRLFDDGGAVVAIVWRDGMDAPLVALHADGELRREIAARADALGLAQHHRPDLVRALRGTPPGAPAPPALWDDLAALMAGAGPTGSLRSG